MIHLSYEKLTIRYVCWAAPGNVGCLDCLVRLYVGQSSLVDRASYQVDHKPQLNQMFRRSFFLVLAAPRSRLAARLS